MQFRVINQYLDRQCVEGGTRVYIGRPSVLGNPFVLKRDGDRATVIDKYRRYLTAKLDSRDPAILTELKRLLTLGDQQPVELSCFCQPAACHGDVIREVLLTRRDDILTHAS